MVVLYDEGAKSVRAKIHIHFARDVLVPSRPWIRVQDDFFLGPLRLHAGNAHLFAVTQLIKYESGKHARAVETCSDSNSSVD